MVDNTMEVENVGGGEVTSLYVGNLPFSTRWGELKDLFKQAGDVAYCDIPRDSQTNRSRGYGLVRFNDPKDAQKAIAMFNGYDFNGRPITVREDQQSNKPRGTRGGDPKLQVFVGNLSWSTTWQDLKDFAKEHGLEPTRADVTMGNDGRSRGWGTLGFGSEADVAKAIATLNGLELSGRTVEVREDKKPSKF